VVPVVASGGITKVLAVVERKTPVGTGVFARTAWLVVTGVFVVDPAWKTTTVVGEEGVVPADDDEVPCVGCPEDVVNELTDGMLLCVGELDLLSRALNGAVVEDWLDEVSWLVVEVPLLMPLFVGLDEDEGLAMEGGSVNEKETWT